MKTYYGMTIDDAFEIVSKMIDGSYTNQDYDDALDAIHDFIAEHKVKKVEVKEMSEAMYERIYSDGKDTDPIRKPSHYMHGDLETKAIIKALLTPEEYRGYCKGNIIKYTDRAPYKGQTEQDYGKRKEYYDWLTEVEG